MKPVWGPLEPARRAAGVCPPAGGKNAPHGRPVARPAGPDLVTVRTIAPGCVHRTPLPFDFPGLCLRRFATPGRRFAGRQAGADRQRDSTPTSNGRPLICTQEKRQQICGFPAVLSPGCRRGNAMSWVAQIERDDRARSSVSRRSRVSSTCASRVSSTSFAHCRRRDMRRHARVSYCNRWLLDMGSRSIIRWSCGGNDRHYMYSN